MGRRPKDVEATGLDPGVPAALLTYAAVALVDATGQARKAVAKRLRSGRAVGMEASNFSAGLYRDRVHTSAFLESLDRALATIRRDAGSDSPPTDLRRHSLLAFKERLEGSRLTDPHAAHLPVDWYPELVQLPPRSDVETMVLGEALISVLDAAANRPELTSALAATGGRERAEQVVQQLLWITGLPPGRGTESLTLLARIAFRGAPFDFDALPRIETFIRDRGVGFRANRVLSTLLRIASHESPAAGRSSGAPWRHTALMRSVAHVLHGLGVDPPEDPYPARSLYLEALSCVQAVDDRASVSPDESPWRWVDGVIRARVDDVTHPPRERAYGAVILSARSRSNDVLSEIAQKFRDEASGKSELRALEHAAEMLLHDPKLTKRPWPRTPEVAAVTEAFQTLGDTPPTVTEATRALAAHAVLQVNGVWRRQAIDALRTAGTGSAVCAPLVRLIEDRDLPFWLREHAAFAAGMIQQADPRLVAALHNTLAANHDAVRPDAIALGHAAAWAIGDILGSRLIDDVLGLRNDGVGTEPDQGIIATAVEASRHPDVRRTATYAQAVTCASEEQRAVLDGLTSDSDVLVSRLAVWGCDLHRRRAATRSLV